MSNRFFVKSFVAGVGLIGMASTVFAVNPAPFEVGSFKGEARADFTLENDDNIFRSEINEKSSTIARISPELVLYNENGQRRFEATYSADLAEYFDSSDDSYLSHQLGGKGLFKLNQQNDVTLALTYELGNEERGTGSSEGDAASSGIDGPTEFTELGLNGLYEYGDNNTPFNFSIDVGFDDIEYDNFKIINRGRDHNTLSIDATYGYKFSVATSAFVDLGYKNLNYSSVSQQGFVLDGNETKVHLGLEWSATKNTTGRVGFGVTGKDVDAASVSTSNSSWDIAVEWKPSSSDLVLLQTQRSPEEASGTGVFVEQESFGMSWNRNISPRLSFELSSSFTQSSFERDAREDDGSVVGLSIGYEFSKQSSLRFSYEDEDKDSNQNEFDFDRNVFGVTLSLAL